MEMMKLSMYLSIQREIYIFDTHRHKSKGKKLNSKDYQMGYLWALLNSENIDLMIPN